MSNPEEVANTYGLTAKEDQELRQFQRFKCAICQRPRRLGLDHSHLTGESRGALCWHCNTALGKFGDNPDFLRRAADYLDNPPVLQCFKTRKFGLPGRVNTSRQRRRKLAQKMVQVGKVSAENYLAVYPHILADLRSGTVSKLRRKKKQLPQVSRQIAKEANQLVQKLLT